MRNSGSDSWRMGVGRRGLTGVLVLALCGGAAGCKSGRQSLERSSADTFSGASIARTGAAVGRDRLDADLLFLDALSEELSTVLAEAGGLSRMAGQRDDFSDDELGRFHYILFRFQVCRAGMWDIAEDYHRSLSLFRSGADRVLARLVSYRVMMQLAYADTQFALTFYDQPAARAALNEAEALSGIEAGSYNAILATAIDPANRDARDAAWHHFREAVKEDNSLRRAAAGDERVKRSIAEIERFQMFTEESQRRLLDKRGIVFPSLENRIRHSLAAGLLQTVAESGQRGLSAVGDVTLQLVRPLTRSPFASGTAFTADQLDLMQSLLEPGDILLVYTSGYLTSLFFPGVFKHGIVYVGTPEQRQVLGLRQPRGASARRANLIEALGGGVGWNRFHAITEHSVTLVAVLRAKHLSSGERRDYLQQVVDYLGRPYDLRFDLLCPLRVYCTELIYHTLNGKGGVAFPMVRRFGMPSLAPDDILHYYLSEPGRTMDLVFLGAPDPGARGKAGAVYVAAEATQRLRELLEDK